jgi:excinuclease ABC subunit C
MVRFSSQDVPSTPGVYVFRNAAGDVIYVGKARSLRKRLSTYFQPSRERRADPKLRALINSIDSYEVHEVSTESEALLLESRLIKQYHPRYNVDLRDDKRFLHICVDPAEPYPRLKLVRIRKDDNRIYFGPFPHARVLRETMRFLCRRFGLRSCNVRNPGPESRQHCLEHVIRDCCCPCTGDVTPEQYQERLEEAFRVLRGNNADIIAELRTQMGEEAEQMKFEEAARTRDMIDNLKVIGERNRTFTRTTLETRHAPPGEGAVKALQQALGMAGPPAVIECFDMSNIGGKLAVGSMVCFRDGRPASGDYRRFRIRSPEASDDTAMMKEVLCRRYRRVLDEERPLPDLIVVDGGRGQLSAALEALHDVGMPPLPLLGLAKKREEIFIPGRAQPIVLPRHNPGLRLLQAIRDEAHRFAISYHRTLRRRRIANSILDEIPGVGEERQKRLLRAFGSVRNMLRATPEEIAESVPGLGIKTARTVWDTISRRLEKQPSSEDGIS